MGPDAVESALNSVDDQIGELVSLVEKNEMDKVTNFVVVSTPGYADARLDHMVNLNSFAKREFNVTGSSPVLNIKPIDNKGTIV